ncbi:MAG: tRNA lysidine(34) synthetase TilS [Bacteroidota bacterium]|nr:tRNA lysidine(34) synthetase TilS [Bacteroidota bacterium]
MKSKLFSKFLEFNTAHRLFSKKDKIILAFSGGPDSVCLAKLLLAFGIKPHLIHINFQLRPEAKSDEAFCRSFAIENQLSINVRRFDTVTFAQKNKYSVEEAARILRYKEFEEERKRTTSDFIFTGHHANDNAETFLINFAAGTGIRGISGIKPISGKIIRPLLFAAKTEILEFCNKNGLEYCIDKSNTDVRFVRNRIRARVVPELQKINPAFLDTTKRTLEILSETEKLFLEIVESYKQKIVTHKNGKLYVEIKKLLEATSPKTILFEILRDYGFNYSLVSDILNSANSEPGKVFYSDKMVLLKDREYYILSESPVEDFKKVITDKNDSTLLSELNLSMTTSLGGDTHKLEFDKKSAFLDLDKIEFPLIYRSVESGDKFKPLGMTQNKLVSDFFIDNKYTYFQKKEARVLESEGEILAI